MAPLGSAGDAFVADGVGVDGDLRPLRFGFACWGGFGHHEWLVCVEIATS